MKKLGCIFAILALGVHFLHADPVFSGYLDSSVFMGAGAGDASGFIYGIEEYANIRLQAKVRDMGTFYGSFNFTAVSGAYAQPVSPFVSGENYAAAMELERLYFKVAGEMLDFQGGLMRLAYGYGLAFGPMDFLNPRNPLKPDARPRAILGADLAFFPTDNTKLQGFTASARNPFVPSGSGTLAGLSGEYHGDYLSVQGLYAFESAGDQSPDGLHRFGLSLKGDVEVGLAADMLYTYDPHAKTREDGLAASLGLDYSFLDGDLYVLAEYLFSGDSSSTSRSQQLTGFTRNHYLFAQGAYRLGEYTTVNLGCMAGLQDLSFAVMLGGEHELFQGFTISLSCQIPLDRSYFDGDSGEFGPIPPGQPGGTQVGSRFQSTLKARLKF
jgi:hypothetical protein